MIEIKHHGATSGVTCPCHELTLTPGMKKGSDPTGSDPRFAADSGSTAMLLKMGSDPAGSDPSFSRESGRPWYSIKEPLVFYLKRKYADLRCI